MATLRFYALKELLGRQPLYIDEPGNLSPINAGKLVLINQKCKVPIKEAYNHLMDAIEKGTALIAKWLTVCVGYENHGHWTMVPLTILTGFTINDATAGKHDAFKYTSGGGVIESFSGSLLHNRADASSFLQRYP